MIADSQQMRIQQTSIRHISGDIQDVIGDYTDARFPPVSTDILWYVNIIEERVNGNGSTVQIGGKKKK